MTVSTDADGVSRERYRRAAEETLQQVDWCIEFLRRNRRGRQARMLAANLAIIRQNLLREDT